MKPAPFLRFDRELERAVPRLTIKYCELHRATTDPRGMLDRRGGSPARSVMKIAHNARSLVAQTVRVYFCVTC